MLSHLGKLLGRRATLLLLGGFILLWVLLFDSHSILNRLRWHHEAEQLREENARMEAVVVQTKEALSRQNDDDEIERIARESYGMRREGETVYRIEAEDD